VGTEGGGEEERGKKVRGEKKVGGREIWEGEREREALGTGGEGAEWGERGEK